MLTATPAFLLQAIPGFPESSTQFVTALGALTAVAFAVAAYALWHVRLSGVWSDRQSERTATRPVPTEETELELAQRHDASPSDDIAYQRRRYLTDATGDHRT